MVKLSKGIFGVPDGEVYPRDIPAGNDCPPGLEGYAASIGAIPDAKAMKKAPETK